jgi:hypothetical protein
MRRAIFVTAASLLAMSGLQLLVFNQAGAAAGGQSGPGVTSGAIKIGITYPDLAAIRNIVNVNPGNYVVAYNTVIDQINAQGGIDGRKIVPVYASVDPLGTAGAATACTQLTEDDNVFAVVGFFQAADTNCYVNTHDTPIIGASLTAQQAVSAKAPWYNYFISDSDQIPKEMSYFKQQGVFTGQKVGVTAETVDQDEMNLVVPELKKLKVDVVQTAINTAPATDTVALTTEDQIIAQRFKAAGVTEVIAAGNAGNDWPRSEQDDQSTYLPRLVVVDYTDLDAYVTNAAGHSSAVLKDAITAGGIPPVKVTWDDPTMKKCIAKIQANEPNAPINDPVTATASTPVTWTAPELACSQMALFEDLAKAAGKTLNNQTLQRGAQSLTDVTLPGGGGTFNFSDGHNDGDGPVFVYTWSPSADNLVLKATIG